MKTEGHGTDPTICTVFLLKKQFLGIFYMNDISFVCEQLVSIVHGEVTRFSVEGQLLKLYGTEKEENSIIMLDQKMRKMLLADRKKKMPQIFIKDGYLIYAVIVLENESMIIGPVSINKAEDCYKLEDGKKHAVGYCELKVFGSAVILAYHAVTGLVLSLAELWDQNGVLDSEVADVNKTMSGIIFERQEYDTPHNPYEQELREMNSITQGNVSMLKESIEESYRGKEGKMAEDEIRQEKNIAIVVIAMASRAAIRGGVLPEKAFSMVDAYVLAVEKLKDPVKIRSLMRKAEYDFAEQVAKNSRVINENDIINHTKNYIFQHLHDEIIIGSLGEKIGVNPSYLSTLFHKTEGITIQLFIRKEKIKLAENMLRYSEYSVKDIANYLSFCTQSHFGKVFKEQTGLSPARYRKMFYAMKDNEKETK